MTDSEFFLVVLVDARRLDYSSSQALLQTLTKHPLNGCKECSVGHAWILLKGTDQFGNATYIEGGHTGEWGIIQPKYFEGVMHYSLAGDSNPIKYLWAEMHDGEFQKGNGGHRPTFAAKINLTREQYHEIHSFIHNYPFQHYSLIDKQCVTFAVQAAALAGVQLDGRLTVPISQYATIGGECVQLWTDDKFSQLPLLSPDILEKSLMEQVAEGNMEYALLWYNKRRQKTNPSAIDTIKRFPERYLRHCSIPNPIQNP